MNRESAAVSIVDAIRFDPVGRIDTGQGPVRIAMSPDGGRIAFTLFHQDAVQVADTGPRNILQTIPVGRQPVGATMSADGELLFVSCEEERRVYVIALGRGEALTTLSTGEGPGTLASLDLVELS